MTNGYPSGYVLHNATNLAESSSYDLISFSILDQVDFPCLVLCDQTFHRYNLILKLLELHLFALQLRFEILLQLYLVSDLLLLHCFHFLLKFRSLKLSLVDVIFQINPFSFLSSAFLVE